MNQSTARLRRRARASYIVFAVLAAAAAGLIAPATGRAAGAALAVTNVSCSANGYSFVVGASGLTPGAEYVTWVEDNQFPGPPPAAQLFLATSDSTGAFSVAVATGVAQVLPATVLVTSDHAGNQVVDGPVSVIPPDCSMIAASATSVTANGTSTSTLTLTARGTDGLPLGASGSGRQVSLSTSRGTFASGCMNNCTATDNGNGTYSLTLTSGTTAGTATVSATINDPRYHTVPIKNTATVAFAGTVQPSANKSTLTATPTSIPANGTSTSSIVVQAKDSGDSNLTTGGNLVTLSTTAGSFPGGCKTACPATDNGNGTYTLPLIAATSVATATVTGAIGGQQMSRAATVGFGSTATPPPPPAGGSARGLKQSVLASVNTLLAGATRQEDADKLNDVVRKLTDALTPSNWAGSDGNHLVPQSGDHVFDDESDATSQLQGLINDHNEWSAAQIQPFINALVLADQTLAVTAINDATLAVALIADPGQRQDAQHHLADANNELQQAFAALAKSPSDPNGAIGHFKNAWHHAEESTHSI